jgi:uncharacterized Zn finger protein
MQSIRDILKGLTHDDLRAWAGNEIFMRGVDYIPCVSRLSRLEDGTLVARVSGSRDYATSVRRTGKGEFDVSCTCPYERGPCKHAVAVLLAAAGWLPLHGDIPLLDPHDPLYREVLESLDTDDIDDIEWERISPRHPQPRSPRIEAMLAKKTREELCALLLELAFEFPEVARRLQDAATLESGRVDRLVRSISQEISSLTVETGRYSSRRDAANFLPDYFRVEARLKALLDKGHADAVLALGEELWADSSQQVEQGDEDGDVASAITDCLSVVLRAVPHTSLTPTEQLLWVIEHNLDDEYRLLSGTDAILNDPRYTQEHWRGVAMALKSRLDTLPTPRLDIFSATHARERLVACLCDAHARGGEADRAIPLLEQEADRCRSYELLVKTLLENGQHERARRWCIHGIKKTIADAPGIATTLQEFLRKLAEKEQRFDLAAAYRVAEFVKRPSTATYAEVRTLTEKIGVWPTVREGLLTFLQTGVRPDSGDAKERAWPLPEAEVTVTRGDIKRSVPCRDMLIEIALLEKRHDDAVSIHREASPDRSPFPGWGINAQLAQAVAQSHPDVSLRIWLANAEELIARVKPNAYQSAGNYLRQMREVYEQTGRLTEWKALLTRLRVQHKAKRRLLEVLDWLEQDRKLVE